MDYHRKNVDLEMINSLLSTSRVFELVNFMAGYAIGKLSLDLTHKSMQQLYKSLNNTSMLINEKMISRSNAVQIVLQALGRSNNGDTANKSRSMINSIEYCLQQIIGNQPFLREKWRRKELDYQEQTKSLLFAQKLIEQEKMKFNLQRQEREKFDLQCQICLVEIQMKDLGTLACGHMFHRECLYMHIKSSIDDNKLQIKCPLEQCSLELQLKDIQQYIDGPLQQKFDQFWFNRYVQTNSKDTSWCPTPGCKSVFQFDQMLTNYRCPGCKKHYCLKCKCKFHNGMTCAEYRVNNSWGQEDRKFQEFVKGAKYKQCPKCNFWVERTAGCCSMRCRCGHQFCYDCGGSDCPHGSCKNKGIPVK